MPPKKLQLKKKKQKTSEASTSGAQHSELLSNKEYAKDRKKRLQKLEFMNHQYLDVGLLEDYGVLNTYLETVKDNGWFRLFEIREPAYKDVTIEFLSTMTIFTVDGVMSMTFQVYGEVKVIELKHVGFYLGLYDTQEETIGLPNSWPRDMTASTFWGELIKPETAPFISSKSLSTSFADMRYKLLHHILAHTISCRKTSHSKVTSFDMFYLYSIVSDYKIDLGVEVANMFTRQISDTRTKVILCGGYITALLKGMGIFRQPERDDGFECKKVSDAPFRLWGLSKAEDEDEAEAEDEDEAEAEAEDGNGAPEITPAARTPTTAHSPSVSEYNQLRQEIRELREENRRERAKHKKFRSTIVSLLKSAISCFNPTASEEIRYQTSSDESTDTEPES